MLGVTGMIIDILVGIADMCIDIIAGADTESAEQLGRDDRQMSVRAVATVAARYRA